MMAGWVALGGFLGAISRYIVVSRIKNIFNSTFPIGTFVVNIMGSFMLGYLLGLNLPNREIAFLGTGFLGAFTTFSTLNVELIQLLDEKKSRTFWTYLGLSYCLGIIAAYLGYILN